MTMGDNACFTCKGRIAHHQHVLTCTVCSQPFHRTCLPLISRDDFTHLYDSNGWICCICTGYIFPFNHYDDDDEFINAVSETWFISGLYTLSDLDDKLFSPFDFDQDVNDIYENADPDTNFFNNQNISLKSSDYYCDRKFNDQVVPHIQSGNPFSFLSYNIRSASKNIDSFTTYLELFNYSFSFIGLSETWFNETTFSRHGIPGYAHEGLYRSNQRGGGVSLFIKEDIPYTIRSDLNVFDSLSEMLFVEVDKSVFGTDKNIIIGTIYRIPNTDIASFTDRLSHVMNVIKNESKIGYYLGDYNINLLNNEFHQPTQDFIDLCFAEGYMPLINKPTRISKFSATLIDNIITNDILKTTCQKGILLCDISDHFPIFYIDQNRSMKLNVITKEVRDTCNRNMVKFRECLQNIDFSSVLNDNEVESACEKFLSDFSSLYKKCFPIKNIKKKYYCQKPWLTEGLKQSIRYKNILYKKYIKNPTILEKDYKMYRNKLNQLLRYAERCHYQELIINNKNNLKKTWSAIKEIINKKVNSPKVDFFVHNNRNIYDKNKIASLFNNFFINIGKSLSDNIPSSNRSAMSYLTSHHNASLFLNPINRNELIKVINDLKTNSSCGPDDVSPKVVKFCHSSLIDVFLHIFNLSFSQGVFPSDLKIAKVIPLFKGGDSSAFNNYRPISVLSVFSKLLERLFYNRLYNFLSQNNILYEYQFGFRKSFSTQLALSLLLDKISHALDNGEFVVGVFLDFSKAFDTVNHDILFDKLFHYGIRGIPLCWLKSYLKDRKQYVIYNGAVSPLQRISCGVPQGSVLGPLLFLLYINDLPHICNNAFMYMFADDSNLFMTDNNLRRIENTLNNELSLLSEWLKSNKLSLNIKKTHFMLFHPGRKKPPFNLNISIDNNPIDSVKHTKFLGVILDSHLSFKEHVSYMKSKISKNMGIIYRAKKFLPQDCLVSLYYSFIYPYLTYCVCVWGNAGISTISPIISLQNRAVKTIVSASKLSSPDPIYKKLNILKFQDIYKMQVLLFIYKFRNNILPPICNTFFTVNSSIHDHRTRQHNDFHPPLCRTETRKKSLQYSGCILWNNLDKSFKTVYGSLNLFKNAIKKKTFESYI
jgi:hypothetical protein